MFRFRFRFPAAQRPRESFPIILTQRRIYILPTRTGLLFVLVLLLMLTGAINYNLSLGYALVFLLTGVFFVTILHTFRNLLDLKIIPASAAPVFAGESASFPVFLENTRVHERRALELSLTADPAQIRRADLPAHTSATAAASCEMSRRGLFRPGRITLSSCYPLGLFRAWSYLYPDISCLVYPQPVKTPLPELSGKSAEAHHQSGKGQDDFSGLRPRQPNEPLRHVAWKIAARDRDRPLLSKQFSGGGFQERILDWAKTPAHSDMETRLSILAGWILESEKQQAAYGLRLPECSIAPSRGVTHRNACLKALALHA